MKLKLFNFTCGIDEKIGVFASAEDAYDRREEVDATFYFLPVTIEEITVPGYVVTITPVAAQNKPPTDEFADMDKPALVAWLKERNVEYVPQWGVEKLKEAARSAV